MGTPKESPLPEGLAVRLARRLKLHSWWDTLLATLPPLLAVIFIEALPYGAAWKPQITWLLAAAALAIAAIFGVLNWRRGVLWSIPRAARLIDQKVAGQERFVTLATINPSGCVPAMLRRLRHEAAVLAQDLRLESAFPYRVKRSFFQSLILSLSAIAAFLLLPQVGPTRSAETTSRELMRSARQLAQLPGFSELAKKIEALVAHVREPALDAGEKRAAVQKLLDELEKKRAAEQQAGGAGVELLEQAREALRRLEQGLEQSGHGGRGGSARQSPGGDSESGTGRGRERDKKNESHEPGRAEPRERQAGEGKKPQRREAGEGRDEEQRGTEQAAGAAKGARDPGTQFPGDRPAERFLKPGEQAEQGMKGARFVTVELPESQVAGEGSAGPLARGRRHQPKSALGNVSLALPDKVEAGAERQPLPLEYRGLIR